MEYATLSNGIKMPMLGYGVYQIPEADTERCVLDAISCGYRSIDTAQAYHNEEGVGNAIEKSGVPREELFYYHQKSGLPMPVTKKQRPLLPNRCANLKQATLTCS